MKNKIGYSLYAAVLASSLLHLSAYAETVKGTSKSHVDNSAKNAVDKNLDTVLPEDQSNDPALLDRTAAIRREITSYDGLSVSAQNIKIVTLQTGTVVLRGPVVTLREKEIVENIAKRVSGNAPVKSYIEIQNG